MTVATLAAIILAIGVGVGASAATAGTPCLESVFFDLGDTLVENPGDGVFVLRPGAAETVAMLQSLNVRLGIITNVPSGWDLDDLRAILAEPDFLDEFEVVILSSQAPAPKPNPAIYTFAHAALAEPRPAIGATAFVGETLLEIGNHETSPTQGARAAGMVGIHLSDAAPSPFADFTIASDSLHHVVSIVENSCASSGVEPDGSNPGADDAGSNDESQQDNGSLRVEAPWPSPSRDQTHVAFALPTGEHVSIDVFDAGGRWVRTLADAVMAAGTHQVSWDGTRANGFAAPDGVYYARVRAGRDVGTKPFLRLR